MIDKYIVSILLIFCPVSAFLIRFSTPSSQTPSEIKIKSIGQANIQHTLTIFTKLTSNYIKVFYMQIDGTTLLEPAQNLEGTDHNGRKY